MKLTVICHSALYMWSANHMLKILNGTIQNLVATDLCTLLHLVIHGLSKRFEHLLLWPPRSPDLTPCDFFLWGYVKDNAYKPPLPQNVHELQNRIRAAVQTTDGNMLKCVWQERLSYWHLQSNKGRSHRAFVSWFWWTWTLTLLMCEIVSYFDN